MRTVGTILKESRQEKKMSTEKLAKETKIRKSFIELIEKEKWDELPEFPVVRGFVKNISQALALNEKNTLALLRRDYPPKDLRINPKPDISNKFSWSPRLTFIVGVAVVFIIILSYLGVQYYNFIKPPELTVESPRQGQEITQSPLKVVGRTNSQATIKVNNQPVLVDEDGNFVAEINIFEGTEDIEIVAVSRSGKETIVRRKILPELGN